MFWLIATKAMLGITLLGWASAYERGFALFAVLLTSVAACADMVVLLLFGQRMGLVLWDEAALALGVTLLAVAHQRQRKRDPA